LEIVNGSWLPALQVARAFESTRGADADVFGSSSIAAFGALPSATSAFLTGFGSIAVVVGGDRFPGRL
jgi:hypothetical protein